MKILAAAVLLAAAPTLAQVATKPAPINWAKGTPTTVTMTEKGFVPRRLVMRPGGHYVLRLHNPTDRAHTFSAGTFFAHARVNPRDAAWIPRNEVELKGGQSATLRLIAPTTPGALYEYKSTRIADAGSKYKGAIIVR